MSFNNDNDDKVGYGKPPKRTQFQKGKSGNPKGRPKTPLTDLSAFLRACAREANKTVTLNENGRRKRITKGDAIWMQVMTKAATGDMSAIKLVLPYWQLLEAERQKILQNKMRPIEQMSNEELQMMIDEELVPLFKKWQRENRNV